MDRKVSSKIVGGNPSTPRSNADFYPTPPEVTQALLDFLNIPEDKTIWEPACGDGHMTKVIKSNGYRVFTTDIKYGQDFLDTRVDRFDWIITNPPFSISDKFIQRAYSFGKPFAFLLKSQYWHAKKRINLFRECTPAYILPLTWRPDFLFGSKGGASLMDVIWCVWKPGKNIQDTYH